MCLSYFISKKLTSLLESYHYIEPDEYDACLYCLDYIVELIFFFLCTFMISICFHAPIFCLVYFVILLLLRSVCGGYHANSRGMCTFFHIFFSFWPLLCKRFLPACLLKSHYLLSLLIQH